MALFTQYEAENCLQPVDTDVIDVLMREVGGDELLQFVTPAYAEQAQGVYDTLKIAKLTFDNVWAVFTKMLPHMS